MAALTIKGVRLTSVTITSKDSKEGLRIEYQLIASNDKVLARETLTEGGEYGTAPFTPSPATRAALTEAALMLRKDVEISIGLDGV